MQKPSIYTLTLGGLVLWCAPNRTGAQTRSDAGTIAGASILPAPGDTLILLPGRSESLTITFGYAPQM
jgi:hypothetical protein